MAYKSIVANNRSDFGKIPTKFLRARGLVPAVMYGKGLNITISLDAEMLEKLISDHSFMTRVFSIVVDGVSHNAICVDVQFDPITDLPSHLDFRIVDASDVIIVNVPVSIINKDKSVGVRRGGDIYIIRYNVKLKCKVDCILNELVVDVADSVVGSKYHLSEIKLPDGVSMIQDCLIAKLSGKKAQMSDAQTESSDETASSGSSDAGAASTPATTAQQK